MHIVCICDNYIKKLGFKSEAIMVIIAGGHGRQTREAAKANRQVGRPARKVTYGGQWQPPGAATVAHSSNQQPASAGRSRKQATRRRRLAEAGVSARRPGRAPSHVTRCSGPSGLPACMCSRFGRPSRADRTCHPVRLLQLFAISHLPSCPLRGDMATLRAAVFLNIHHWLDVLIVLNVKVSLPAPVVPQGSFLWFVFLSIVTALLTCHMVHRSYLSLSYWLRYWMEVSGHLQATAVLVPGDIPWYILDKGLKRFEGLTERFVKETDLCLFCELISGSTA